MAQLGGIKPGMSWVKVDARLKNHNFSLMNAGSAGTAIVNPCSHMTNDIRFMATVMTAIMVPSVVISQGLPL